MNVQHAMEKKVTLKMIKTIKNVLKSKKSFPYANTELTSEKKDNTSVNNVLKGTMFKITTVSKTLPKKINFI